MHIKILSLIGAGLISDSIGLISDSVMHHLNHFKKCVIETG